MMLEQVVRPDYISLQETLLASKLFQLALQKKRADHIKNRSRMAGFYEWLSDWAENDALLVFVYEPLGDNPNFAVAQLFSGNQQIGKMLFHHHSLEQQSGSIDPKLSKICNVLSCVRLSKHDNNHKTLIKYREILQFVNVQGESLFIDEFDGAIRNSFKDENYDGYGIPEDTVYNPGKPGDYPQSLSDLLEKLHEYGHAYRFWGMTRQQREVFMKTSAIEEWEHMSDDQKKEEVLQQKRKKLIEEVNASTQALLRIKDIFDFLGIGSDTQIKAIIDFYAENLACYLPDDFDSMSETSFIFNSQNSG